MDKTREGTILPLRVGIHDINRIEIYMHNLSIYLCSEEGQALPMEEQRAVVHEVQRLSYAICLYDSYIDIRGDCLYLATHKDNKTGGPDFVFGAVQVASEILEISSSRVHHVCSGRRKRAKNYSLKRVLRADTRCALSTMGKHQPYTELLTNEDEVVGVDKIPDTPTVKANDLKEWAGKVDYYGMKRQEDNERRKKLLIIKTQ